MTDTNKFKFRPVLDTRYNVQETDDGDLAVFFDRKEVIDLYDESNAMDEVSWCENGDPQTEQSEPVREKVKFEIVLQALDQFFDRDVLDYIYKYAEEHIEDIENRQSELNQEDHDLAYESYLESRYEDY
jgi:hypothetical protein